MKQKQFDIEEHEKDILRDFEKGEFESIENAEEEMQIAKEAAHNFRKKWSQIPPDVFVEKLN